MGSRGSPKRPAAALDEAQFLRQQAQQARDAMLRALELAARNLAHGADPRAWAREHPWLTVGAAAAGGFLAAVTLVPTRQQQLLRELARIERAIAPPPPHANGLNGQSHRPTARHRLLRRLLRETFKLVRPALLSAITAGITAKAAAEPRQPDSPADDPAATPQHHTQSPMSQ
ncbi:hypothetical protein [Fontivita pretiosa]|uniref:hypothetical protein n=1 Tax=Fontivita pretiosa TaxID=2989684 RepID=UPI003D16C1B7